jgi:hypothetical protein
MVTGSLPPTGSLICMSDVNTYFGLSGTPIFMGVLGTYLGISSGTFICLSATFGGQGS